MSQPFTKQNKTTFSNTTSFTSIALNQIPSTAPSEWGQNKNARKLKKYSISHLAICELQACNMRMVDRLIAFFFSCLKRLFIYTFILPFKYTADGFSIGVSTNNILLASECKNSFLKFAPLKCKTRKFILS